MYNPRTTALLEATSCEALHGEFVGSLTAICGSTLNGFVEVLVGVAISGFFIMFTTLALVKIRTAVKDGW